MTETEKILETIAACRAALIPEHYKPKARPPEETRMARLPRVGTESLFELAVIADALEAFGDELAATVAAFDGSPITDFLNFYSQWKRWCGTHGTRSASRASSASARRTTTRTASRFRRGRRTTRRLSRFAVIQETE